MYKLPIEYARKKQQKIEEKAPRLGHEIVYAEYQTALSNSSSSVRVRSERQAVLHIRCPLHPTDENRPVVTTYDNYLRARNGLSCCGQMSVSKKLTGRIFSEETKQKMAEARKRIQATKPRAEDKRDSVEYERWRADSQQLDGFQCQITNRRPENLEIHHLFSMSEFPSIMYNPLNSVGLDRALHMIFHKIYGYRTAVTIDSFILFLNDLISDPEFRERVCSFARPRQESNSPDPSLNDQAETQISNQTSEQSGAGPETRVDDPNPFLVGIMKLHERMVEKRAKLLALLTPAENELVSQIKERLDRMTDQQRKTFSN